MADIDKGAGRKYWRAVFYDINGKRRFKSTKTKHRRNAQAIADSYERKANDPDPARENTTSLGEALELLIAHMQELVGAGRRSPGTKSMHRDKAGHLKRVFEIDDAGDHIPFRLSGLTAAHVDSFIAKRRAEGAKENTIAKELVTLGCTLKLAKRRGLWAGDTTAVLPTRFAPEYKPGTRWLTPVELKGLLAHLPPDHAARTAFAIATSANRGECFRAQRADISTADVHVRGTKRTSRLRTVPLVTDWQRRLLVIAQKFAQGSNGKLFAYDAGFHNALLKACEDAGVAPCTSNDLRRTFCHWMRQSRIPRDLVAAMMGHGSTAMVDKVYGKLTAEEIAHLAHLVTGTTVAQTSPHHADQADVMDGVEASKSAKVVPEEGLEPTRAFAPTDFESVFAEDPTPREYKRKRKYDGRGGTTVAQRSSDAEVIPLPKVKTVA